MTPLYPAWTSALPDLFALLRSSSWFAEGAALAPIEPPYSLSVWPQALPLGSPSGNVAGGQILVGTAGDDLLTGGAGDDALQGLAGADSLLGLGGADTLDGGPGPDRLDPGPGNDVVRGGGGFDLAVYSFASTGALIHKADGSWQVTDPEGGIDTLWNVERAQFTDATLIIKQPNSIDVTGDGSSDVLLANTVTGQVYLWGLHGTDLTQSGFLGWAPGPEWRAAGAGDVNGDGHADIVLQNTVTADLYLWGMDGTANGAASVLPDLEGAIGWTPTAQWQAVGLADMNGDGMADVVLRNLDDGSVYTWQMHGRVLADYGYVGWTPGPQWRVAGLGDFNADGKADIALQNSVTGDCYLWLLNGRTDGEGALAGWGDFTARPPRRETGDIAGDMPPPTANWQVFDTGDYNGDGRSDILMQDRTTGDCYAWLMDGMTVIGSGFVGWRPGAAWVSQRGGDMNGDGNADVLLRNSATGESYVWLLDGTTVTGGGFIGWATSSDWQSFG